MVVASYIGRSDERKRARKRLKEAREVINNFPILKSIADNFKPLAHRFIRNNRNSLFLISSYSTPKDPLLMDLEYALRHFRYKSWSKEAQEDFARRLVSPREDNSWSPFCEMNVALRLEQRYGRNNVIVYPSHPGPDISAKVQNRLIGFEVTGVFPGKTEDRLKEISRGIAKGLYSRTKGKRYLRVDIQTTKLPKGKKGRFRIRPSIKKVLTSFDELGLATIVPKFRNFNLNEASDYIHTMTAYKNVPRLRNSYLKGLEKGFRTRAFKTFIERLDQNVLEGSPITHFLDGRAKRYRITEVGYELFAPSRPAQDEQNAILDRLEKRILGKVTKAKQLVPGRANVLVVNAQNWTIHGFDFSSSLYDWQSESEPVRRRLRSILVQHRPANLSAIMIYERDFRDARIVENRFARRESALTTYEGMSLFTKKRIGQLRRLKEAERMRKKVIHSKVIAAEKSVVEGYEAYSEIKRLAFVRPFNATIDRMPFVQIHGGFQVPKSWFKDPRLASNFGESGQAIGIREVAYLVRRILEECDEVQVQAVSYDSLSDAIDKFSSQHGTPNLIFVPLTLHLVVYNWIPQNPQKRVLKFENGIPILVTNSGVEIPIHWLTSSDPDGHIIIYKKTHGEWIVKPGKTTKELTVWASTKNKEDIKIFAKTVAAYKTLHKNAAWRVIIRPGTED